MSSNIPAVFNFTSESSVRVVQIKGDPWFIAADVCEAIGIETEQTRRLDSDEKGLYLTQTPSGSQQMTVISEPGMYSLVMRCRDASKPGTAAYRFRKWVTSEVLPSIRKTGGYSVQPNPEPVKLLPANPDVLSTFFGALRAYVGASIAKAPLWIGVSEHVFSELGITDLNGLNDDNIGQAIRVIADVNGANIGAMRSDYYRIG